MSHGPGKMQRLVLDALAKTPAVYTRDLLPTRASASQRASLSRAVNQLWRAGKVLAGDVFERAMDGTRINKPGGRWRVVCRLDATGINLREVVQPGLLKIEADRDARRKAERLAFEQQRWKEDAAARRAAGGTATYRPRPKPPAVPEA